MALPCPFIHLHFRLALNFSLNIVISIFHPTSSLVALPFRLCIPSSVAFFPFFFLSVMMAVSRVFDQRFELPSVSVHNPFSVGSSR